MLYLIGDVDTAVEDTIKNACMQFHFCSCYVTQQAQKSKPVNFPKSSIFE